MKILFISTEIWSEKNPEGIVARKIVEGLIQNGCLVDVLSTKKTDILGVNKEIIVEDNSSEFFSKVKKKFFGVEKKAFVRNVKKMIETYNIACYYVIITRSEPFFLHEIGCYVKEKYPSIRWIASFGDPVFINPYNANSPIKRKIAKRLELKYWDKADIITHTNKTVLDEYERYGFNVKKSIVLENPFTMVDMFLNQQNKSVKDKIVFGYVGSLYGKRTINPVVDLLSKVNFDFELLIIGGVRNTYYENRFGFFNKYLMSNDLKKITQPIENKGLKEKVTIIPFMKKGDLDELINEKIDVLINIDAAVGEKNIFLSSKIVEYLQYKKPILNFSIEGATVNFLKNVGVDFFVDFKGEAPSLDRESLLKLTPTQNIDYYTSKNVCKRLIDRVNSIG